MKNVFTKVLVAGTLAALTFSACTKSSTTATSKPPVTATIIGSNTILSGGAWKGTMLNGTSYTVNGDITILTGDSIIIQPGAAITITNNSAFYVNGIIRSVGTQANPITFTAPIANTPGQWGGFQGDSAQGVTFQWTKIYWAGGNDSTGSTRETISVSSPIPVDVEDCWLIGGQDNGVGVSAAAQVTLLRNTIMGEGTTDGEGIDLHDGCTGTIAYNLIWGGAGSGIKVVTSSTVQIPETNILIYNNTCVDNGFRRGAAEPGRGVLVDEFASGKVFNNLLVNNYWGLDITTSADTANTTYGNNYFYATVDSLLPFFYPVGDVGFPQPTDIISLATTGANNPMFVNYTTPPDPSLRIVPTSFDFHLQAGSPALGKGNMTYNKDIGAYTSDGQGNKH
jgi:hypothetical protein